MQRVKFHPFRDQILVSPEDEETRDSGIVVPVTEKPSRRPMLAEVLMVGPEVKDQRLAPGSCVMFWSNAGAVWRPSGQNFRILSECDLFGLVTLEDSGGDQEEDAPPPPRAPFERNPGPTLALVGSA